MLWLPKWLRENEAPQPTEGVSRRTFLFLGASAAVAAALPTLPAPMFQPALTRDWVAFYRAHYELHVRRPSMATIIHAVNPLQEMVEAEKRLHTRVSIATKDLVPTQQGAWMAAVQEERAAALCEAECALKFVEGRWEAADGQVLFRVP